MEYGLYLHIPYCQSRCRYCDFYSSPGAGGVPQAYVDALIRDFERYAPRDGAGRVLRPSTVYFGGGTPGLLSVEQVEQLLVCAGPLPGAEITLEANPGLQLEEKLAGWRAAGVNRLSLGVQSASDASLRRLGRIHTAADAQNALLAAKRAGFDNVSGDIMLALPGYTNREFDDTLALLRQGGATHVSAYPLKIEPGTAFGRTPPPGLPDADRAAEFYLHAAGGLEAAGYAQYEISNFARPGFEGRHNLIYWDAGNWLGLGPAAHSALQGRRFSFAPNTGAFLEGCLTPHDEGCMEAEDYIMLRLRLTEGLDEDRLEARYGLRLSAAQTAVMEQLRAAGYALRRPGGWALTPGGMLVQNAILARLLA